MPGQFGVVANERDHPDWVPPMPRAFVDTPPRRNEVGLRCGGVFHSPSRKRTAEDAQFEDHPQYVEESAGVPGIQPVPPFLCLSFNLRNELTFLSDY